MASGFKIADAFVEVEVDLDRHQVTRASVEAGRESGKAFSDGAQKETQRRRGGLVGAVTGSLSGLVGVGKKIGTKMGAGLLDAATTTASGLSQHLPKALSNPYVLAGVVAAATTVGVFAGAALNGAILAALGTGVVAAGIALAARDPRVKAEAEELGGEVTSGLAAAATSFISPVREAINYVKAEFRSMLPDIDGIFTEASGYVMPLTQAVVGFVRNILPGIRAAVANLGPVFEALKTGIPELGATIGNAFEHMSKHGEGAASALSAALEVLEFSVNAVAATVTTLTIAWEALTFTGVAGHLLDQATGADMVVHSVRRLDTETQRLTKDTHEVVDATKTFIATLDRLNATAINAIDTEGAYQRAIDEVARAKKEEHAQLVMSNGALVQNTERQRAGAAAINEVAKAALAKAAATHEATLKTGTLAQADAAARESVIKSRAEFVLLAQKLGLSAAQAKALADQLLAIPAKVTTTVTTKYIKVNGGYQLAGDEGVRGHKDGGLIRGPGTGTSDSIVRRLSDGEYVLKAAAVKRIGKPALDALNATGQMPAGGGGTAVMERAPVAEGGSARPIMISMDGAAFYGVGSADQFVAQMYDALDRHERKYR